MKKLLTIFLILLLTTSAFGQFQQKPMLGEQIDRAHQLGDPVTTWFFNEGSGNKVSDLSGNGRTGTLVNSPLWVPGKFGSAILGNGTNQYISFGTDKIVEHDITVVMWVYLTSDTGDRGLFGKRTAVWGVDTVAYSCYWDDSASDFAWITHGDLNYFTSATTLPLNQWVQLVLTQNSTTAYLYKNGVLWDTCEDIVFAAGNKDGIDNVIFAGFPTGDEAEGKLDHCLIYNRFFTASEIALLYREPFCMLQRDNIALVAIEAPAPGGQVIFINTARIALLFVTTLILIKRKNARLHS